MEKDENTHCFVESNGFLHCVTLIIEKVCTPIKGGRITFIANNEYGSDQCCVDIEFQKGWHALLHKRFFAFKTKCLETLMPASWRISIVEF